MSRPPVRSGTMYRFVIVVLPVPKMERHVQITHRAPADDQSPPVLLVARSHPRIARPRDTARSSSHRARYDARKSRRPWSESRSLTEDGITSVAQGITPPDAVLPAFPDAAASTPEAEDGVSCRTAPTCRDRARRPSCRPQRFLPGGATDMPHPFRARDVRRHDHGGVQPLPRSYPSAHKRPSLSPFSRFPRA